MLEIFGENKSGDRMETIDLNDEKIMFNKGRKLYKERNYKEALFYFEQAVKLNPNNEWYKAMLDWCKEAVSNSDRVRR